MNRLRNRGGTIVGFMIGLVLGLAIAVFVAIFVTRAPVPFVNKVGKPSERLAEPKSAAEAPDPNKPLYSKSRSTPGTAPQADASGSVLGNVLGSKGGPAAAPDQPVMQPDASDQARSADTRGADERGSGYLLQAGAFRSQDDAEGMKAKLALIGFEARVLSAEVSGQTMYRVRVGPYAQLDDMNKARAKLAESGIEASVVRQR